MSGGDDEPERNRCLGLHKDRFIAAHDPDVRIGRLLAEDLGEHAREAPNVARGSRWPFSACRRPRIAPTRPLR